MEIKRLPAVAPTGPARAASPPPRGRPPAVSEGAGGENPLSVAAFSVAWRRFAARRLDLAAEPLERTGPGSPITAALFEWEGGKQLLEV